MEILGLALIVIALLWALGLFKPIITLSQMASEKTEMLADQVYVNDIRKAKELPSEEEVVKAVSATEALRAARRSQWGK